MLDVIFSVGTLSLVLLALLFVTSTIIVDPVESHTKAKLTSRLICMQDMTAYLAKIEDQEKAAVGNRISIIRWIESTTMNLNILDTLQAECEKSADNLLDIKTFVARDPTDFTLDISAFMFRVAD
jgi:hypothetical protein